MEAFETAEMSKTESLLLLWGAFSACTREPQLHAEDRTLQEKGHSLQITRKLSWVHSVQQDLHLAYVQNNEKGLGYIYGEFAEHPV